MPINRCSRSSTRRRDTETHLEPDALVRSAAFKLKMAVIPASGGALVSQFDILNGKDGNLRFTPDGRGIAYPVTDDQGVGNLWMQPLSGGSAKQLTDFKSDKIFDFAWSPNGQKLAVSRGRASRDVVLLTDTTK